MLVLGESVKAPFEQIDDHEILSILGRDHSVQFSEVLSTARAFSDVYPRWLPLLYPLRTAEAWAWGSHPERWHAFRLLEAFASGFFVLFALRPWLSSLSAALVSILLFCGPQAELWLRLGNSEVHAFLLLSVGLALISRRLSTGNATLSALLPGLLLVHTAGYLKESFIPIAPAVLLAVAAPTLLQLRGPRVRLSSGWDWASLALMLLLVGLQCAMVLFMLRHYGHVYAGGVTVRTILETAAGFLRRYAVHTGWPLQLVVGGWACLARHRLSNLLWPLLVGATVLVPQCIVYAGQAPTGRYLVPGILFALFCAAWGLSCSQNLDKARWAASAAALLSITLAAVRQPVLTRAHVVETKRFDSLWRSASQLKRAHPGWRYVFVASEPGKYEPILSTRVFLAPSLEPGERPVLVFEARGDSNGDLGQQLAMRLTRWSIQGSPEFSPASSLAEGADCIEIGFSTALAHSRCRTRFAGF